VPRIPWISRLPPSWQPWTLAELHVIHVFHQAGATSPLSAQPLSAYSALDRRVLDQLRAQGVIKEPESGRYYLDEQAARPKAVTWVFPWLILAFVVAVLVKIVVTLIG
jgi:hypothetical protein